MYCNKCEKEIKDGYTFCSNCGNKAEDIKNKQENEQPNNKKIGKMNKTYICSNRYYNCNIYNKWNCNVDRKQ